MAQVAVAREILLRELEDLSEDKVVEVIDFIRFLKSQESKEEMRRRFARALEEARAIAKSRGITDEDVLEEIKAVREGR
ncbi:MAG: hypothetical protein DRI61_13870 [Chloroflexi bacterium]|nr:MAG: hypothetical protein DRI61_13870 [Chloroflexota bacterium]